jgi:medium-chain acyl-[acyl-carrier-protein] hydrolase
MTTPVRALLRPRPNPGAALRLLCFPFAGAGASAFRTWPEGLPGDVEILAFDPPGHEGRAREKPLDRLAPLVSGLADAAAAQLRAPFAIYGHSLGALVGFAFACELRRRGLAGPVHLFVSGRRAPQIPDPIHAHTLPDAELALWLRQLGGIPDAVFAEPELMAFFLPILRADLALNCSELGIEPPLACPITALGGLDDPRATVEQLDAWRVQTCAAFDREMFVGGHFFLQSAKAELLRSLSRRLSRLTAG